MAPISRRLSFAKTPQGLESGPRNNVTEHSACYSFQTHFEFWRNDSPLNIQLRLFVPELTIFLLATSLPVR